MNTQLKEWETLPLKYSSEDLKNVHFQSTFNFLYHYSKLPEGPEKIYVSEVLDDFIEKMRDEDYLIERINSEEFTFSHILKISEIYRRNLGFQVLAPLRIDFILGLFCDVIIFFIFKHYAVGYFFPICCFLLVIRNRWKFYTLGKQFKLYGPRY